jgi:hypothetical protein
MAYPKEKGKKKRRSGREVVQDREVIAYEPIFILSSLR